MYVCEHACNNLNGTLTDYANYAKDTDSHNYAAFSDIARRIPTQ